MTTHGGSRFHYISVGSKEKSWGLYVTGVGHALVEAKGIYPPVPHPAGYDFKWQRGRILEEFALLHLAGGAGVFESAHQSPTPIHGGDCVLLFPGEWHRYRPDSSSGWEEYWVTFQGDLVESWRHSGLIEPRKPLLSNGKETLPLVPLFEDMLRLLKQKPRRRLYECAALCHLLIARLLSEPAGEGGSESKEERIHEAGDYLRINPEKDIDLSHLARSLGMSYSTFRRSFAEHFGASPDKFHQEARVTRIKRFLIETELPLKKIAERLHYSNEFYLMQVFKRKTGLTPTQWRRQRHMRLPS